FYSVLDRCNPHAPISSMRARMKVAVVDKCLEREANRSPSSDQRVLDVSGVLAPSHPDALFEKRVGKRKPPDRSRAFQAKTLDVEIAFRLDRAIGPTICRERVILGPMARSEEHTSELQSQSNLVCRLLLEKKTIPLPSA